MALKIVFMAYFVIAFQNVDCEAFIIVLHNTWVRQDISKCITTSTFICDNNSSKLKFAVLQLIYDFHILSSLAVIYLSNSISRFNLYFRMVDSVATMVLTAFCWHV